MATEVKHTRFDSRFDSMWVDAISTILAHGQELKSRDGGCKEVLGYRLVLSTETASKYSFLTLPERKLSLAYAHCEFLWYMACLNDVSMMMDYAPQYGRFADANRISFGAYGWRWENDFNFQHHSVYVPEPTPGNQILMVAKLLREKPETRQAVVTMWNAGDLCHAVVGDKSDIPCTLSFQFLLRDEKDGKRRLHMIATMRSQDVWLGLPYDCYVFTLIQSLIAANVGCETGLFVLNVASEHLYDRNHDKAVKCVEAYTASRNLPLFEASKAPAHESNMRSWSVDEINDAIIIEREVIGLHKEGTLTQGYMSLFTRELYKKINNSVIRDAALCCIGKWGTVDHNAFTSPMLSYLYKSGRR